MHVFPIQETSSTASISSSSTKINIKSGLKEMKEKAEQKAQEQNNLRSNVTYKLIDLYEIRYNYEVNNYSMHKSN